ncbi:MAG: prepilin peptidase [Verrucomicrobiota bacterium]
MSETIREVEAAAPWFFPLAVFIFGACWGSFLNVVIYRVPAGKSVVTPGSQCACGKPIDWYDNIPILTWFLRGGKARCCDLRFSIRYPIIELLTAVLFLIAWLMLPPAVALAGFIFIGLMIAATFIDLDTMTLPDAITVSGCIAGVLLSVALPQVHGYIGNEPYLIKGIRSGVTAIIGAAVGSGVILWIALSAEAILRKEAMGFGDVILMGCIGAFCGWQGALFAIFGGALMGCIIVLPVMILQKVFCLKTPAPGKVIAAGDEGVSAQLDAEEAQKNQSDEATTGSEEQPQLGLGAAIPFGPWLALGGLVYYLGLRGWVDGYLSTLQEVIFMPL